MCLAGLYFPTGLSAVNVQLPSASPLVKLAPEGPDRVTARLYSEVLDMEVTAVGMEIPWAGGEDAYLMACEKVKTQKKK